MQLPAFQALPQDLISSIRPQSRQSPCQDLLAPAPEAAHMLVSTAAEPPYMTLCVTRLHKPRPALLCQVLEQPLLVLKPILASRSCQKCYLMPSAIQELFDFSSTPEPLILSAGIGCPHGFSHAVDTAGCSEEALGRSSGLLGRVGQGVAVAAHDVGPEDVSHVGPLALGPGLKVAAVVLVGLLLPDGCTLDRGEPAGSDGIPPLRRLARRALLRLQPQLLIVGLHREKTSPEARRVLSHSAKLEPTQGVSGRIDWLPKFQHRTECGLARMLAAEHCKASAEPSDVTLCIPALLCKPGPEAEAQQRRTWTPR